MGGKYTGRGMGMDIMAVSFQIMMLLGIALVGLWLRHRQVMGQQVIKGINSIVLQVAWPAMVLMATQKAQAPHLKAEFLRIFVPALVLMCLFSLLLYLLCRRILPDRRAAVFAALGSMPNAGFVGLPIVQALYGDEGVLLLSAFIMGFSISQWTVGVYIYAGRAFRLRDALWNPGFISALVGLLVVLLDVRLPEPFRSLSIQLGGLTTPLAMLLAGARLYEFRMADLKDLSLWAAMGLKLLAFPLLSYLILRVAGLQGMALGVLVLGMAMPSAVSGQMFAERYEKDSVYAAAGVSLSLMLCLLSIPLLMALLSF